MIETTIIIFPESHSKNEDIRKTLVKNRFDDHPLNTFGLPTLGSAVRLFLGTVS